MATSTASIFTYPRFQALSNEGNPLAGGQLFTYQAGTLIPQATYTDSTLTVPNTNPIILDAFGTAAVWLGQNAYKFNLLDVNSVQQANFPIDNISGYGSSLAAALASTTSASLGQGIIGFNPALSYPLGTFPAALASTATGQGIALIGGMPFTTASGVDPTGSVDCAAVLNTALASGKRVFLPPGNYKTLSTITIPANGALIGAGRNLTTLTVSADVLGILMSGLDELGCMTITKSGTHTHNMVDVGNASGTVGQGRDSLYDLVVANAGQDGICIRNGNLGSMRDVSVNTCTRDGINFTIDTANANAWSTSGFIDLNTNGRDGLHLSMGSSAGAANSPRAHLFHGICAQSSARYGVYVGTTSNLIETYAEASGTADVYLDTYGQGNEIRTTAGFVTDNSTITSGFHSNLIQNYDANASYFRMWQGKVAFSGVVGAGIRIGGDDGTGGQFDMEKSASGIFKFMSQNTNQDCYLQWLNTAGTYAMHQQCSGTVQPLNDNTYSIGTSSRKWGAVYTYNVTTSNLYVNTAFYPTQTYNGTASVSATTISTRYAYIATPATTITVTLPAAAAAIDGQVMTVVFGTTIATSLTWVSSGATFVGAPAAGAIVANVPVRFIYIHAQLKWFPY